MARENPPNFRPNCEKISRQVDYRDFSEKMDYSRNPYRADFEDF